MSNNNIDNIHNDILFNSESQAVPPSTNLMHFQTAKVKNSTNALCNKPLQ